MDNEINDPHILGEDKLQGVSGGYSPGNCREEALRFLKEHMNAADYDLIMRNAESRQHPYVAARICLCPEDWEKYVWIEQHGSLSGFGK